MQSRKRGFLVQGSVRCMAGCIGGVVASGSPIKAKLDRVGGSKRGLVHMSGGKCMDLGKCRRGRIGVEIFSICKRLVLRSSFSKCSSIALRQLGRKVCVVGLVYGSRDFSGGCSIF